MGPPRCVWLSMHRLAPGPSLHNARANGGAAHHEQAVTLIPFCTESTDAFVVRVGAMLLAQDAQVLAAFAYGSTRANTQVVDGLKTCLGAVDWPLLWVEGASCRGGELAGMQFLLWPRAAGDVERIVSGGRVVGTVFQDADVRHCLLGGLTPDDASRPRADQAQAFFSDTETVLRGAGFTYGDLARTWFYNDAILAWYDDFNRVRSAFYAAQRFSSGSSPASTAVAGRNAAGSALVFGAWAVQPLSPHVAVREVASPLQCPAPAYGSSFSRAVEIVSGGRRRLLVSGTASIEPGGKTVWQGNTEKQIELTMAVVDAILASEGYRFADATRATAYFKHAADIAVFENWAAAHQLQDLPVVPVHCDICRDDLLFEIELDLCVAC
jgi:enamine deaminase RidA (YjgF/YER057c/UK114 family)